MHNQSKHILYILLFSVSVYFLFLIISCSKDPAIHCPTPPASIRKVFIETFSGHYDGHGAIVSDTFQHIQQRYPGNVIGITIHSGYFAKVFAAPFEADFHSNEGDAYFDSLGVIFNPTGTVNRIGYPDKVLKSYAQEWYRLTDSLLKQPAYALLKITRQYNSTTRILSTSVHCNFIGSLTGTYKLVVLLTEDDIIAAQKDYAQPYPQIDYQHLHRHVLRDGITSTWGDLLNTAGMIAKGDSVIKNYSYKLPATFNGMIPNENNCHIVAYIYNTFTYEVLQVEEIKLQ
jgi:hypothetical protein